MKAIFFDFDGTIFDSAPYWEKVLQDSFTERNIPSPGNIFSRTKTLGVARASEWFVREFSPDENPDNIARDWREKMAENYTSIIPLKMNVGSFLRPLRQQGIISCLATAMDRYYVLKALERENIADAFDYIITTPELNCDKRGPDIYLHCADRYSLEPGDCMVLEDALEAALACKGAGFHVTGIYDGVGEEEFEKIKEVCDYSFVEFPESLEYLNL